MSGEKFPAANNENARFRGIYHFRFEDGSNSEHLIPYIPKARWFIERYVEECEWKHDINHHLYVDREYYVCMVLHNAEGRTREHQIEAFAIYLRVNPILLFNDPGLEF